MDIEKETLVLRVMSLGVFKAQDRRALRTMSINTLREIIRTINLPQHPVVRGSVLHTSATTPPEFVADEDARVHAMCGRR